MLAKIQDVKGFPCDVDARESVVGAHRELSQQDGTRSHNPGVRGSPCDRLPERCIRKSVIVEVLHGVVTVFEVDEREPGVLEAYWFLVRCSGIER